MNRLAFGRDDEADLVGAFRAGGFARLSLVSERNGAVIGHLLFGRLPIETAAVTVESLALAPVAVLPGRRRRGVGSQLIHAELTMCRERGHGVAVVLGHAEFYPRFGFSADLAVAILARRVRAGRTSTRSGSRPIGSSRRSGS